MSRDYEPVSPPKSGGKTIRNILILILFAFVGGVVATGWAVTNFDILGSKLDGTDAVDTSAVPVSIDANAAGAEEVIVDQPETIPAAALPVPAKIESNIERALTARVADLEDRLSRINVQAQAASGNAARAEGLLIAFAARRALDTGSPLGYIEGQLRLRFGNAQPKAVNTIINAANNPVTLEELRSQLDDLGPTLTTGSSGEGFWTDLSKEVSEIFVLRKEGTPSPAPQKRLLRAKRYLEAGNVDAAYAEIKLMPGVDEANAWVNQARRYTEARRGLDLIETAAILETKQLRASDGKRVEQPSPLAPADTPAVVE